MKLECDGVEISHSVTMQPVFSRWVQAGLVETVAGRLVTFGVYAFPAAE